VQGDGVLQDACVNQTTHPQMNTNSIINKTTAHATNSDTLNAVAICTIEISQKKWNRTHKNFKSIENGKRFMLWSFAGCPVLKIVEVVIV
jgi:hypothetical protein